MENVEASQNLDPIFKQYDMSPDEIKIYRMMLQYQGISRGNNKFITMFKKNTDPRTARWWKAFEKFSKSYRARNVDTGMFFKAQFKKNQGKFIPNFLDTDASFKRYDQYMKQYEYEQESMVNAEDSRIEDLEKTHKFINDWLLTNGYTEDNYEAFFEYKEDFADFMTVSMKFAIQGYLSMTFLSISKTFGEIYETLDTDIQNEIIPVRDLQKHRTSILSQPKVMERAIEIFGKNEIRMNWGVHVDNDRDEERIDN